MATKNKKPSFKCPNCQGTESMPVYEGTSKLEDQEKCVNCGYVITKE